MSFWSKQVKRNDINPINHHCDLYCQIRLVSRIILYYYKFAVSLKTWFNFLLLAYFALSLLWIYAQDSAISSKWPVNCGYIFFYSKLNQRQQWNHFSFYLSNVIFNSILKLIAIHGNAFFQKKQIGFAGLGSDSVHRCLNDDVNFHSNKIGCVPLPCSINGKTLNLKNIFKKHRRC